MVNFKTLIALSEFVNLVPSAQLDRSTNSKLDSLAVRISDSIKDYNDSARDWQGKEKKLKEPFLAKIAEIRKLKMNAPKEDLAELTTREIEVTELADNELQPFIEAYLEWQKEEFEKDFDFTFTPEELEIVKGLYDDNVDKITQGLLTQRKVKNQVTQFLNENN